MRDKHETGQQNEPQHEGYLMAYDKKVKKARGVTGIDGNGNLTMEDAEERNKNKFMRVDKHGNILSNFTTNFLYQFNNPSGFLFYNISKGEKPETAAVRIEKGLQSTDVAVRKEQGQRRIYNDHQFNEREIDWQQAGRFGITPELLQYKNSLEAMLQGKQSPVAFGIRKESELGRDMGDAKLSLYRADDGSVKFDVHFMRQALKEGQEFHGYKLTGDDIRNLETTGNLGHTPELIVDFQTGERKPCYVSKDPITNEMFHIRQEWLKPVKQIRDHVFTPEESAAYQAGKEVPITFTSANGDKITTGVQVNAQERGLELLFERSTTLTQEQKNAMAQSRKNRQTQGERTSKKRSNSVRPR